MKISTPAKIAIGAFLVVLAVYLILFFILRKAPDTSIKDVQAQIKDVQQSVQRVDTTTASALQLLQSSQLNYKAMIEAIERSERAANSLKQSETAANTKTAKTLQEMIDKVETAKRQREQAKKDLLKFRPLTQ